MWWFVYYRRKQDETQSAVVEQLIKCVTHVKWEQERRKLVEENVESVKTKMSEFSVLFELSAEDSQYFALRFLLFSLDHNGVPVGTNTVRMAIQEYAHVYICMYTWFIFFYI